MPIENVLWELVLVGMTLAYGLSIFGVRAAKRHEVTAHGKWKMVACGLVGLWLVAYITKQMLVGRDQFGGTVKQYWSLYFPLLILHTSLAMATIGLGATNKFIGLRKLRKGTGVGAMVGGLSRHRRLGHMMQWTFAGTLMTAYVVYAMLFLWFPAKREVRSKERARWRKAVFSPYSLLFTPH